MMSLTPDDGGEAVVVVDTTVLLNLATPVVDGRPQAPTGADPLKALLTAYDVHIPTSVLGELADATGSNDLLSAAAALVLQATHHLTTHDADAQLAEPLDYGLDRGESDCIRLANELAADLFITDEFNTTNYLFITLALDDRNTLFTTPHILCTLATHEILPVEYVAATLTYYIDTKHWDAQYIAQLRQQHLYD
jgi:predicted nucleic acid-binding protein